jgi:hypothetical protein
MYPRLRGDDDSVGLFNHTVRHQHTDVIPANAGTLGIAPPLMMPAVLSSPPPRVPAFAGMT